MATYSWNRTLVYSLASRMLGKQQFSTIGDMNPQDQVVFDGAWPEFFPIFISSYEPEFFTRQETLDADSHQIGGTAIPVDSFKKTQDYSTFWILPDDGIRPLEVNFIERAMGEDEGIWKWGTVTVVISSVTTPLQCLMHNSSAPHVKFVFLPDTPPSHDTSFSGKLNPEFVRFLAAEFAADLAPLFGKNSQEILALESRNIDRNLRALMIEGKTGTNRRRKDGDIVKSRQRGGWRGGVY